MRPDIVVRDESGRAVLWVEVKARHGVDGRWASELRRNLRAHGAMDPSEYFMIVTSTDAYLWREDERTLGEVQPPDAEASLRELVGDPNTPEVVDGGALELLVGSWLSATATATEPSDLTETARTFLVRSGLFEALHNAEVEFEPA